MYLIDISRNGQPSYDARVNQSLDNYFVNDLKLPGHGLMFYVNQPSVIIGRNQNVWAEVDIDYLHEHNIQLVRRTSGGGAVYHDMGNFIFENILTDDASDFGDYGHFAEPVLKALQTLGINVAMKENSSDLILDGKKWSGMTMFKSGKGIAAGGTIMYDLNIENAKKVLTENQDEKRKRLGVLSKRSPIVNLKDYLPDGMTMADFREYLLKELFQVSSLDDIETYHMTDAIGKVADQRLAETYGTDEWNFGHNPGYYHYTDHQFEAGKLGINWTVTDGKVAHIKFNPFFKATGDLTAVEQQLVDRKPSSRIIKKAVKKGNLTNIDADQLAEFLESQLTSE
ncbi:lipoyltransferase and lipoate-protein ligase [Lentilactobacillus parafarraginis F0439]|uniref:lipoate--protein ligase n=1 Tax=Lentilactobacillus parafarraginis F0439 TaxID=797515 RepID=G9ZPB4_9LACO|nr:lipoate--protein ligase [Lentilactobacillus parafarraginis]EHL98525.1 lipoyltransferase and lipoate-protein ligase [Lentilactobacillus parafarraginis F0439]